ncbi:MAG: class I SAM-dependent methyltransferase [Bacteroidota bacterium]
MAHLRTPLQGVTNIVRFNWHFYVLSVVGVTLGLWFAHWLGSYWWHLGVLVACGAMATTITSLIVSWYVYDYSELYSFNWSPAFTGSKTMVNIHAGFDETSTLLAGKYPEAKLHVFDFYDPELHTEVSIKRARKAYGPYPGTEEITTKDLPLAEHSVDVVWLILAAHEIRSEVERAAFFRQLRSALRENGRVVVVEHLRDWPNFLAYSIGFFHFLPASAWRTTFANGGFSVAHQQKITPFITVFTLSPHVATP